MSVIATIYILLYGFLGVALSRTAVIGLRHGRVPLRGGKLVWRANQPKFFWFLIVWAGAAGLFALIGASLALLSILAPGLLPRE